MVEDVSLIERRIGEARSQAELPLQQTSILAAEGLRKSYRKRTVVDNVSLDIHQNEIVGLLGPNGAGKTTIFYMIVGLERPDAGRDVQDRAAVVAKQVEVRRYLDLIG